MMIAEIRASRWLHGFLDSECDWMAIAYLFGYAHGLSGGTLLKGIDIESMAPIHWATNVLRTLGKWPALVVLW